MASLLCFAPALLLGLLPLAATAQLHFEETHPPVYYHVGLRQAPLYRSNDTLRSPAKYLPSQSLVHVIAEPPFRGWVVVKEHGFQYLMPAAALADYDPGDAATPPLDAATHRIAYQGVVQVPGATAAELLDRARAWVPRAYPQQNATVALDDAATGELRLQGTELVHTYQDYQGIPRQLYAGVVHHTLTIYVKDGRYKYVLTDLVHDAQHTPNMRSGGPLEQQRASLYGYAGLGSFENWTELKTEALRDARHLTTSLEEAMTLRKPVRARPVNDF